MPMMFSGLPRHSGTRVTGPFEDGVDDLGGRIVGVERDHFGAVDHHVADGEIAQIEQAAEHVAIVLLDAAFLVQQIDGAAQRLVARQHRLDGPDMKADAREQPAHQPFDERAAPGRARRQPTASAAQPPARSGPVH